ncbi:alpha-1,4-glucan--maltose-1-phosphate maltosyltransferase [Humidisolicoccus flavus]|uniref:alpha-1,4-glucan--maltose-1-phosphate maltosyltransferase n=1 Tax=Humidisolicoccus flavus TaxID=3111414 RepID=UPI003248F896
MKNDVHIGRIPIRGLSPVQPDDFWPAKAVVGDVIPFQATIFREGHDLIASAAVLQSPSGEVTRVPMVSIGAGTDRFEAKSAVLDQGMWHWHIEAWSDEWATWMHNAEIKIGAGVDVELMFTLGAELLLRSAGDRPRARVLRETARKLTSRTLPAEARWKSVLEPRVQQAVSENPPRSLITRSRQLSLKVERTRAGVGAWYEFFPRSEGAKQLPDGRWVSGTFATATARLGGVAAMGFDILYLPPIHPIGEVNRKGPNNTLTPGPEDPGSPWAIGSRHGGHDTIHPDLGTLEDFKKFVAAAKTQGLEVAIDFALQAAPDHPWVKEHPEWFTQLPDGTIAYAENPPKKYQDIYPINFDNDPDGICAETLRILRHWIACGVTLFRVDNPHTKPVWFWEWVIREINAEFPDIVFLAEAFTRPAMMQTLAGAGFQQSYTYFTWRNTKQELAEYLQEVSDETAAWFRPNFWVNTPDILTEYLQFGGAPAYKIRATLAALGSPSWGMYAGFELQEDVARPGSEENIDNEKYEYKARDWAKAGRLGTTLAPYITMLNRVRSDHAAVRQLRGLTVHESDDDAILVFSKHLEGKFTRSGKADTVLVVVNTDPHSVRESMVHLDLDAIGKSADERFTVRDLVTGARWEWGADNYVRLDPFVEPVHILVIASQSADRNQS